MSNIKPNTISLNSTKRMFSSFSSFQSKKTKDLDIDKAIKLLSNSKSLTNNLSTEGEKLKYINHFTKALNNDLKESNNPSVYLQHFNQSISGINQLLSCSPQPTNVIKSMDPISLKTLIAGKNIFTTHELILKFDELINNEMLTLKTFGIILSKIHLDFENLNYIYTKLNFMNNNSNKYDCYKILLASKLFQLQQKTKFTNSNINSLINHITLNDLNNWLELRNNRELNKVLEKALYQIIFRASKSILLNLNYNNHSLILLIESLPSQQTIHERIIDKSSLKFSKNQEILINFLKYIISNRDTFENYNKIVKRLIKLSIDNHVFKESSEVNQQELQPVDKSITIYKFRFINGINEMYEEYLMERSTNESELQRLYELINEKNDHVHQETVLRFL
ncbi:hypothetical protein WICMUC_004924 [Wickerhamomyces mucosus]|uniref:Uncharacterized protein n=1 Tax=Wickerhamomyces mucosus TaxID=1378264 RepID=A0A9P8PEB4_9ASCO|nr:hypothetical protein WICMUC_004924 [Wickerhamomyces mucosus]